MATATATRGGFVRRTESLLNSKWHGPALAVFLVGVVGHMAEHAFQAVQIYALGMPPAQARGMLGAVWPWLVTSEWLHYAYALFTLAGLALLLPAFQGHARTWWLAALGIQVWHHFEHVLLLGQALTGRMMFGMAKPTSVLQLVVPRVELHMAYNLLVFIPLVVGWYLHRTRLTDEPACACAA